MPINDCLQASFGHLLRVSGFIRGPILGRTRWWLGGIIKDDENMKRRIPGFGLCLGGSGRSVGFLRGSCTA